MEVTKAEMINAIKGKKYKRLALIFNFYKDHLFKKGYSAEFIANQISKDLEIEISKAVIYNINKKFINVLNDKPTQEEKSSVESIVQPVNRLVIEQQKTEMAKEGVLDTGLEYFMIKGKMCAIRKALTAEEEYLLRQKNAKK